jgi:hypothetical protein
LHSPGAEHGSTNYHQVTLFLTTSIQLTLFFFLFLIFAFNAVEEGKELQKKREQTFASLHSSSFFFLLKSTRVDVEGEKGKGKGEGVEEQGLSRPCWSSLSSSSLSGMASYGIH